MEVMQAIRERVSVRAYVPKSIPKTDIDALLDAGIRAPSGKNGQPWRFVTVQEDKTLLHRIADCTIYKDFVGKADCLLCVFLDKQESYHYIKDCQAVGACIQNILLAATARGLGACWIGEILNRDAAVKQLLGLDRRYDLMAIVALGYPSKIEPQRSLRKSAAQCTLFRV